MVEVVIDMWYISDIHMSYGWEKGPSVLVNRLAQSTTNKETQ